MRIEPDFERYIDESLGRPEHYRFWRAVVEFFFPGKVDGP